MQKNKYPRIQLRLLFSLALFVIVLSINSILYILDVKKVNYLTQEIINHPFTVSNSVRDIEIKIHAIHRSMKDVTLAKNKIELSNAIKEVNKHEKLIYEKFDVVEERFLGNLNTVNNAKQSFKNWKPIRDEVIALVKKKQFNEAAEITKGKGAIHVEFLLTKTHEMIDFANNKAKEFNDNSIKIARHSKNKSLFLLLCTLLIGVIIFVWIFNSIAKPIRQLINRVRTATKNQLTNTLPPQTNNILDILDYAISELENKEKRLEEEINIQTKELKEARNLIENAIDNASIGMTQISFDGNILDANQAFCRFIGYSKPELLKLTFNDITHEKDKERGLLFIQKVLNDEMNNEIFEKSYIHKSGKIIQGSVGASVVKDNNNRPIYLFAQIKDITKQKEYELELIEHKKGLEDMVKNRTKELGDKTNKLIRSQKALTYLLEDVNESQEKMKLLNRQIEATNKELETFSYSVSHDLKAPLRAVIGFSQILEEDYSANLSLEAKKYIDLIKENAENMGELINHLLNFSRLGRKAMRKVPVDLKAITERIKSELEAGIQSEIPTFNIHPMPLIHADESLMYHVMQNLISNAVKFTKSNVNPLIEIGCVHQNNEVIFYIKDNGIGFEMKYAEKIFDIFQRLHHADEYEGTGVGLAIVQRIILKHEGKIWVQSIKNEGTTFFFTF